MMLLSILGNLVRTADGRLQEVVVPDALAAGGANGRSSSGGRGGRGRGGRGGRTLLGVPRRFYLECRASSFVDGRF